jgi:hypothetical protein
MINKLKPEDNKYIRSAGNGFSICVMPYDVKALLFIDSIDSKHHKKRLGRY